jgi:hypothetical protein
MNIAHTPSQNAALTPVGMFVLSATSAEDRALLQQLALYLGERDSPWHFCLLSTMHSTDEDCLCLGLIPRKLTP